MSADQSCGAMATVDDIQALIEALEFVVSAYEGSPPNERTMGFYEARNVARAAIAKTTGVE
jgi:hypothetical protein